MTAVEHNLCGRILQMAAKCADRVCLETADGANPVYGDLDGETARFANALSAAGVMKGDRVAVQVEKSWAVVMLYLACLRLGAVYLPLNTAYTMNELEYFIGDAEPSLVVCGADRANELDVQAGGQAVLTLDAAGRGTLYDAVQAASTRFETVAVEEDDLAAILYTSGTTGRSKGAMMSHGNLISNAETLIAAWGITASDVLVHALPVFHVHGLFVALNTLLLAGGKLIYLARFVPADVLGAMGRGATMMMGVPTYYTRLLADPALDRRACADMRLFVSGSAPLLAETFAEFKSRTGHAILERYGMTETGMNTSNPLDGERRPGTVGAPLAGVEARVVGEDGALLPAGQAGILEVRGPNVFKGYWRMPDKTAAEFRDDGFFITGDVAEISKDGYVSIVGREKDMIISGGLNIYPKEIETVIDALEGVVESAVIGVPHPDFGEAVVAVIVNDGAGAGDEQAIIAGARAQLAGFKVPKAVCFQDALPRNTMGKVQKNVLRDQLKDQFATA
jgi:malonyl-CoA/methylmalonyl-CoA synthetase